MDGTVKAEADLAREDEDPHRPMLEGIIKELVTQRLLCWMAKKERITDRSLPAKIYAMCWDFGSMPARGPGCLVPNKSGYVYVPYDDSEEGMGPELQARVETLVSWCRDNRSGLVRIDKMMEKEVAEKCWWEFLDGGNASCVDFHGKVRMLARNRLIEDFQGVDVFPNDPAIPRFQFGVSDVTEYGNIKMKWRLLSWDCTEDAILRTAHAFSRPSYTREKVLGKYLRDLELIHHPESAAKEARDLSNELRSQQPDQKESSWSYYLCNSSEVAIPFEDRTWTPLKQLNDIKLMKRLSRERSRYAIIIRPWLLRHYKICNHIYNLQSRQERYCEEVEMQAAVDAQIRSEEARYSVTEG